MSEDVDHESRYNQLSESCIHGENELLGACGGLIFLKWKSNLSTWNPMGRDTIKLVAPHRVSPGEVVCYGFGCSTNEVVYKVVQVSKVTGSPMG